MYCVGVGTTLGGDTRRGGFGIITGDASGCCYCSFWLMIDVTCGAGMRTCCVVASWNVLSSLCIASICFYPTLVKGAAGVRFFRAWLISIAAMVVFSADNMYSVLSCVGKFYCVRVNKCPGLWSIYVISSIVIFNSVIIYAITTTIFSTIYNWWFDVYSCSSCWQGYWGCIVIKLNMKLGMHWELWIQYVWTKKA